MILVFVSHEVLGQTAPNVFLMAYWRLSKHRKPLKFVWFIKCRSRIIRQKREHRSPKSHKEDASDEVKARKAFWEIEDIHPNKELPYLVSYEADKLQE